MDFSSVDAAKQSANSAAQTANDFTAGGFTLADQLRQAIGSRFGESGVAQEGGVAQANLLANPAQARSHILDLINAGTILSPTQQNSIMASSNASALAPVIGNNILQQAQFGTLQDLINAGTNAWNAQTTRAQGAATLAEKNYNDMLNELVTRQTLQQNEAMGPLDIAYKQALINQANQRGTTAVEKYPFSEPWISAGLAGQPVSQIGNKVGVDVQTRLNQQEQSDKALLKSQGTKKADLEAQILQQKVTNQKAYDDANWFQKWLMGKPN